MVDRLSRSVDDRGGLLIPLHRAMDASHDEPPRVQQVLGLEQALRPSRSRFELDPEKISDLAKYAISHLAQQIAFIVGNRYHGLQRDRKLRLHTSPTQ